MMTLWRRMVGGVTLALALASCGGGGGGSAIPVPTTPAPPTSSTPGDINLLFMGNSHTSANNLPGMVGAMVRAARPGSTVTAVEAPGWMFLEERSVDPASLRLLNERRWNAVVLQAQKYSTSGQFSYSTDGAKVLISASRAVGALPVMFPEWPRRGIDETQRIYDLHTSIAQAEPACVAPVGQAWDLALARHPTLVLHAADGNHSAPAGAFLAALVIAATYAQLAPEALPELAGFDVDAETQSRLRAVAAETLLRHPPRRWCPGDA